MNTSCTLPVFGVGLAKLDHSPKTSALVDALVEKTMAPRELVLTQTLSFYSALLQALIDVDRPGVGRGAVSLYTLTIADSGERKTTVSNLLTKPISEFQRGEEENYLHQLEEYEVDIEIYENQLSHLKRQLSQEIKKRDQK